METIPARRVEWTEMRKIPDGSQEAYCVIAERNGDEWQFYERSSWDVLWTCAKDTLPLKQRLAEELAKEPSAEK